MKKNKRNMIITGVTLGTIASGAAYFMLNKQARDKANDMLDFAVEETRSFFEEM